MHKNLVIVESPAKAKTIGKFLAGAAGCAAFGGASAGAGELDRLDPVHITGNGGLPHGVDYGIAVGICLGQIFPITYTQGIARQPEACSGCR